MKNLATREYKNMSNERLEELGINRTQWNFLKALNSKNEDERFSAYDIVCDGVDTFTDSQKNELIRELVYHIANYKEVDTLKFTEGLLEHWNWPYGEGDDKVDQIIKELKRAY